MPDTFDQVSLSDRARIQIMNTNSMADILLKAIAELPCSREKNLAITKLEECVMWANKCAARNM